MNFDEGIRQREEVGGPRLNPLRLASAKHLTGQAEGRGRRKMGLEEYPSEYYQEFLEYVKDRYEGRKGPG